MLCYLLHYVFIVEFSVSAIHCDLLILMVCQSVWGLF